MTTAVELILAYYSEGNVLYAPGRNHETAAKSDPSPSKTTFILQVSGHEINATRYHDSVCRLGASRQISLITADESQAAPQASLNRAVRLARSKTARRRAILTPSLSFIEAVRKDGLDLPIWRYRHVHLTELQVCMASEASTIQRLFRSKLSVPNRNQWSGCHT